MLNIDSSFDKYFPELSKEFKLKEFQKKVIENTMLNDNTLCIMPTGGGKSLIYWMTGLMIGGITIVISPLTALIDEQTKKIREQGYEVLTLHGGINSKKQQELLISFANGKSNPNFIFVSPEKLATDGFFEHCIKRRKNDVKLITIDEVHCVSQWGTSFRPFYKRIPSFLNSVFFSNNNPPRILALTATLNPKEVKDVCEEFNIDNSNIIKDELLMRSEITLKTLKFNNEVEKEEKFWNIIKCHATEKILVYVYRIKSNHGVKQLSDKANEEGYKTSCFHGEMTANERSEIIEKFKKNDINIIFATSAFGMGIDIPDIRVIIHYMIPESVEQYYQEIGRAARDKKAANAYLLYTSKNIEVKRKYFINSAFPSEDELKKIYKKVIGRKIGINSLPYFEDEEIQKCLPYYLDVKILKIICKGFSNLKSLNDIKNADLKKLVESSKTKSLISAINKMNIQPQNAVNMVYSSIVENEVKLSKPIDRRLLIEKIELDISDKKMENILNQIKEKKDYKHGLLDYFIFLISSNPQSNQLHQEIASYLGVNKHLLGRIYSTSKGNKVRSKSEVIISNLLYQYKVKYEYEKKLYYENNNWIEPDFTIIMSDGSELYWEHLGMLGMQNYDKRWLKKLEIYEKYFPGKLITTYEGATLSDSALDLIKEKLL